MIYVISFCNKILVLQVRSFTEDLRQRFTGMATSVWTSTGSTSLLILLIRKVLFVNLNI